MKKFYFLVIFCLGLSADLMGQVGINTTDPKALLDIPSSNVDSPGIMDGILIPRINDFPSANPNVDQHGMLVFLNTEKEGFPSGFYFWNDTEKKWSPITANAFSNFYKEGTNKASNDIDDAIYRTGNIRIGGEENEAVKLSVTIGSSAPEQNIKTGLEILNDNTADTQNTYSITATNSSLTGAIKYGIKNTVSAAGEGIHYGIWNDVSQNNSTSSEVYGIHNSVGRTYGATKKHYGIYSEIGTASGNGIVYGIYSKALGTDEVYAGFFEGKVGIGSPSANEEYIFPALRGKENQVLVLADEGNLKWEYPNIKNYTSIGTATGKYVIPKEVFTLRITNTASSITIPAATENKGRIIILINWHGNSRKDFNFLDGDEIYDITVSEASPTITGIDGGERLTIQSIGTRWILLDATN